MRSEKIHTLIVDEELEGALETLSHSKGRSIRKGATNVTEDAKLAQRGEDNAYKACQDLATVSSVPYRKPTREMTRCHSR